MVLLFTVTANTALAEVELTYWTHEDPNRTEIENKYIKEFEAANPGVKVNRVTSPSGKMAEKVLTAFAANRGPDMFNMEIERDCLNKNPVATRLAILQKEFSRHYSS